MSTRKLPLIQNFEMPEGFDSVIAPDTLAKWVPELELVENAAGDGQTVIEIYDVIGADAFFGGISSRMIAGQLRGAGDVIVNINSPGGSFVEGNAIYNMLVQHQGKVTVRVVGWAASAASIVAMAGDEIAISQSGFIMIHNGQAEISGDRNELREVAALLDKVDDSLAGIYAARTGLTKRKVADFLDAQTTLTADEAVKNGFADSILGTGKVSTNARVKNEVQTVRIDRMLDMALSRMFPQFSRSERIDFKNALREGKRDAVLPTTRDAGMGDVAADLRRLVETF